MDRIPDIERCRVKIREIIEEIHPIFIEYNRDFQEDTLKSKLTIYFVLLVGLIIKQVKDINRIYNDIIGLYKKPEEVAININRLSDRDVAQLIIHLFDIFQYYHIDIRKEFDLVDFNEIELDR